MQYNVSGLNKDYSSNIQNIPQNTVDYFNFNLSTIQLIVKKKASTQDQKLKDYDLIKNAMNSMNSMYNNVPSQMKSRIDNVFNLLGQAGISINNPLNHPNQIASAMDDLSELGETSNANNIFMLMDVDEGLSSTTATATVDNASTTEEASNTSLQSAIYNDFIKYYCEKYQIDLQSLGEALQMTQDTLNNLTTLSDFLTRISFQDPPKSNYPFTSNDDILNMGDDFLNELVEILNKSGNVTVDPKTGKLVSDSAEPKKGTVMGYGDYFLLQIKGDPSTPPKYGPNPDAYMLVNNVGKRKEGLDSQIQDLWIKAMSQKIPIYPSDAELLDMGKQVLEINKEFKDYLAINDPDGEYRNKPGDPAYLLNEVVKSIDATFKPYTDLVEQGVTDQKQLNDALIDCTKKFLLDGQDDPSSANQNKLGKQLQRAESSFSALSEKKTRELQAKNTEYTNFLQQGAALMRMLNDLIVRTAQNAAKAS